MPHQTPTGFSHWLARTALVAVGAACLTLNARADNANWGGGNTFASTNWSDGLNWLAGIPPANPLTFAAYNTADGAVTFDVNTPASLLSYIDTPWSIGRLVFPSGSPNYTLAGADLTLAQAQSAAGNGNLDVSGTPTITISNNIIILTNAGTAFPRHQFYLNNGGTVNFYGSIIKATNGPGEMTLRGASGTFNIYGGIRWDANAIFKTETGTSVNFYTTNNQWNLWNLSLGTIRIWLPNALPTNSVLSFNQADGNATLELNDNNQALAELRNPTISTGSNVQRINTGTNSGGTLTINHTSASISNYSTVIISGNGRLVKNGAGTLTFGRNNSTYTGGTLIAGGTLRLGTNGAGGGILGPVTNNATLIVNRTDTQTFDTPISGTGILTKLSTGALVLNGTNTYSGNTAVNAGILSGRGSLASAVTVATNAQVQPGVGSLPGTLTLSNNLTLNQGAFATLKLNSATTVGSGVNDLLDVKGALTLNNNPLVILPVAPLVNGTYRLANYGTLSGTFGNLTNTSRYTLTLDYSTPGQINLQVSGANASVAWRGTNANWDLTTSNWLNGVAADRFYQGDAATFEDAAGLSTNISVATTLNPGGVNVTTTTNLFFTGAGKLSGTTGINKTGSGLLHVANTGGNDYLGTVNLSGGTLRAATTTALGATNGPTIVTNGATLDVNNQNLGGEPFIASGDGVGGLGAIINTGAEQQQATRFVTLTGNTTIGGPNRWDIRNPADALGGALLANGYSLTKTGANYIGLVRLGETSLGDLAINSGTLEFSYSTTMGNPAKSVVVNSNATLAFWNLDTNGLSKLATFNNGTMAANSGSNYFAGPITLNASNTIANSATLYLGGALTGPGGFNKLSAGRLYLAGANTYTGTTTVSSGSVVLTGTGSLDGTPFIYLATNTVLDVSAKPGFTFTAGQVLAGNGSVAGDITFNGGFAPGASPGTLNFSNNLAMANTTSTFELGSDPYAIGNGVNDLVNVSGNLSLSGLNTIKIVPLAPLNNTTPYSLFQYLGTFTGSAANLNITTDSRYSFNVMDPVLTYPWVQVSVVGSGTAANLVWKGGASGAPLTWDTKNVKNWLNGGVADSFFPGDTTIFDDTGTTSEVSLVGNLQPASVIMSNSAVSYRFTGSGGFNAGTLTNIAGNLTFSHTGPNSFANNIWLNGGQLILDFPADVSFSTILQDDNFIGGTLAKAGPTTLTLNANNQLFTGGVLVNGGVLRIGNVWALGNSSGVTTVAPGGTLDVNALNLQTETVVAQGAGFGGQGAIVNNNPTTDQQSALKNITLNGDATVGGVRRWDAGRNGGGAFLGNGYKLTKVSSNQISLLAFADTGLGDVDIREGVLSFELGSGLGDPTKNLTIYSNAVVQFWGNLNYPADKKMFANYGRVLCGNGTNSYIGPVTIQAGGLTNDIYNTGSLLGYDGPITGPGALTKIGASTLTLSGANSWLGGTFLANGITIASNSLALGTANAITVTSTTGGTGLSGTRLTLANGISVPAGVSASFEANTSGDIRSTLYTQNGTNSWNGPLELRGNGIINCGGALPDSITVNGPVTGATNFTGTFFLRGGCYGEVKGKLTLGGGVMNITDNSTWLFTSPNNTWTNATIAYGRAQIGVNNGLPTNTSLTFGQTGTSAGTLDLNGYTQELPAVSTLNGSGHFITSGSTTSDSLFVFNGGTNISTFAGRITDRFDSNATRTVAVTVKSGTFILTSVASTYTGPTLVQGALRVDSGLSNTVVTVATGGTLAGNGTILGPVTVQSGGTLSAGASIGRLTISNNLVLAAGSTNFVELSPVTGTNDFVAGLSNVTYGGTLVLSNVSAGSYVGGSSFKLYAAATYTGSFAALVPAEPGPGLAWDTSALATSGTLKIASTAAPAISSFGLLGDGNFSLTLNGTVGQPYSVRASTNVGLPISLWTLLTNGTIPAVPYQFNDLTATNYGLRFYLISTP